MHRIFVYGTLKRGGAANYLLRGAAFLGAGSVTGRIVPHRGFTAIILDDSDDERVLGEVFELPGERANAMLTALDEYEGEEYARTEATVRMDTGGTTSAMLYTLHSA